MQLDIFEKVLLALREVLNLTSVDHLKPSTKLKEDLGLDSMTSLTFLMALEDKVPGFSVNPETLEMSDLDCIESIAHYVSKQVGKN